MLPSNSPSSGTQDQLRALVGRIVESRHFRKSARLRDLLLYLTERVLKDGVTEIHEQEVGHRVFGRSPDYDTASDNIVRVHASMLRKRLDQYFAEEGATEPLVIDLPRGNYALLFRERAEAAEPAAQESSLELPRKPWWRLAPSAWVLVGTALFVGAFLGVTAFRIFHTCTGFQQGLSLVGKPAVRRFWSAVYQPGQRTDIVLDDAALGLFQELTGKVIPLAEYYDRGYLRGLEATGTDSGMRREMAQQVLLRRLSSFAAVNAVWRLQQLAMATGSDARPVFSRDYTFQSLKSNSAILLGHGRTNPWVQPFEGSTGVRWVFDKEANVYYPVDTYAPASDRERYRITAGKRDGQGGYALVILTANLRGGRTILLLSATGGAALEAAIEFLTNEGSMTGLLARLPAGRGGVEKFPHFEALLNIPSRSRRPEDVVPVICRPISAAPDVAK